MKNKITIEDHEKLKVLNLLMWLQASLYAADECETVKWFYNHQTKMLLKRLNDSIQKQHGRTIASLWDVDGTLLPNVTQQIGEFTEEMATYGYWMLPELTKLIQNAKEESEKVEVVNEKEVL
jgi:hypothetical protein